MKDAIMQDGLHYEQALSKICDDYERDGWTIAHDVIDKALDQIARQQVELLKHSCAYDIQHTDDGYKITVKIPPSNYYHYGVATVKADT